MEEFSMEIPWSELINRGLNKKIPDLKPQIDKLLSAVVVDEIKKRFPKYKNTSAWHYEYIRFLDTSEKYMVIVAPGLPKLKG